MGLFRELDLGTLATLVIFFAIALGGPILVVRVFVKAERKAARKDILDAFDGIKDRFRSTRGSD